MALATAALATTTAAAYLDARFHLRKDLASSLEARQVARLGAHLAKINKRSLWYLFEAQARALQDEQCIWFRASPAETPTVYTWTQVHEHCCRWARFLEEQGVRPGELVGTYMVNGPEFMFNMLGCWALGAAPAMINCNLGGEGLVHCLKVAGGKVLVVDGEDEGCRERVEGVRGRLEGELGMRVVVVDAAVKAAILGREASRPGDTYRDGVTGTFPIFIFYTSGTTGFPKACPFETQRSYGLAAPRLRSTGLVPGRPASLLRSARKPDVWYDCMPLYHGTGCTVAIGCLVSGLTLAIGRKFSVRNFWPDIHDSNANAFVYVGETARYLLAAPPSKLDKGHKLKAMFGNGMRPDVWDKFQARFEVPCVNEFFNSTEGMLSLMNVCRGPFHVAHVGHHGGLQRWGLRGKIVPVEIDHETGGMWRDPKTGFARRTRYEEGGEIIVQCASEKEFVGYVNNPSATAARFERDVFRKGDLYYRTGDALRRDHDGRWFFMDRLGDTFRWKSDNVSTAQVAEVLGRFPGVVEANVYGVEVPSHDGRAGCAALYIRPHERENFDWVGLREHASRGLPKYAVPAFVRLIRSPAPSHNQKQIKGPLRKEGVEHRLVREGEAGKGDVLFWARPGGRGYEVFGEGDWVELVRGRARLAEPAGSCASDLGLPILFYLPTSSLLSPLSLFLPAKLAVRSHRSHSDPAVPSRSSSQVRGREEELPFLRDLREKDRRRFTFTVNWSKLPAPATLLTALLFLLVVLTQLLLLPRLAPLFRPPPSPQPSCPAPVNNPFIQELYCRAPAHRPGTLYGQSQASMALAAAAERVAAEFEYPKEDVNRGVQQFIKQMDEGLSKQGATLSQIPTYVTAVPNGTEKGLYMAVDLGGTNFRVCSIQLHGNSTFSLTQSKVKIPQELMVAKTSHELFAFLAKQIETFLKTHHGEHYMSHVERRRSSYIGGEHNAEVFQLGFTFSFPVQQSGINKGTLIRWTKGFDIHDTIGKDVCALLQKEIDALNLPVRVAALVNDTVGTLMARSYTSPGKTGTLLGAIFGTGTNGAYVEKLDRVTKLKKMGKDAGDVDSTTGEMIVNTEWGSFDNEMRVLPDTPYDHALDKESNNPGIQMFEKRVSGMFLGEILRRALVQLIKDPAVPLFSDEHSNQNDMHSTTNIHDNSNLWNQWGLDTSFLSITSGDNSAGLKVTRQTLDNDYGVSAASAEDAEAVRLIASAIGKRAARLSAVAIAAVVISTHKLDRPTDIATTNNATLEVNEEDVVDIGVDGSLVEFYPNFEEYIREALREIPEIGVRGERRMRIGIAKDGSGVGAALIALVADKGATGASAPLNVGAGTGGVGGFFGRFLEDLNRNLRVRV
ncbi:hypothetical protein B0A55_10096 [Friedmanniomyces simplex]|uniref:glucokinase n=1 Tax=Friedmanniomyces simplex TaxID=329884 RepID=A0A4U0WQE6_9PEZI|nr:hypothetical protein B0A55_10096 [Friedmanniomyces simplex]